MAAFETLLNVLAELATYLGDANKRIYYLYLLSAIALSIPVYFRRMNLRRKHSGSGAKKRFGGFFAQLFDRRIWLAPSAIQDYWLWLLNKLIKTLIYAPFVLMMVPVALGLSDLLENVFGHPTFLHWPQWAVIGIFTLALFVLDDLSRFILHYLLHKVPLLWQFHKVHHSATVLTPFTIYRSHPLESYLYACRMALSQGIVVGAGYYLFGPSLSMYDIAGANIFVFVFNLMGSNLRHSHIRLSWGDKMENWFISPAQHQIHHSDAPQHVDTNLGSALAIWDRLSGTLVHDSAAGKIRFGLGKGNSEHKTLAAIYIEPFKLAFRASRKPT